MSRKTRIRQTTADNVFDVVNHLILVLVLVVILYPLIYIVSCSFSDSDAVVAGRVFLLPVKVEGRENIKKEQAYIFVGNHQSMFDILLMLGFLGHRFKWMMKKEIGRIPLIGYACKCCGFITVDRGSRTDIAHTMNQADKLLRSHSSLAVFAEGTRTKTGRLGNFKRGAFKLAVEQNLPIVPVSINGGYEVMPKGQKYVRHYPLRLVIHAPIVPNPEGEDEMERLRQETRNAILSGLDEQYTESR